MDELRELNGYIHDFTAAMFTCGSILLWMILRVCARGDLGAETVGVLGGLARRFFRLTLPALVLVMISGGVRMALFMQYEHPGPLSSAALAVLIVKHVLFLVFVLWGLRQHLACRRMGHAVSSPGA